MYIDQLLKSLMTDHTIIDTQRPARLSLGQTGPIPKTPSSSHPLTFPPPEFSSPLVWSSELAFNNQGRRVSSSFPK